MITWIIIFIFALFLGDMILSYFYLKAYKKQFPKGDWTLSEQNPIIRYALRSFGFNAGMIIGAISVFIILLLIINNSGHHFHYFIAGIYYMMCLFHWLNFMALKRLKKNKKNIEEKELELTNIKLKQLELPTIDEMIEWQIKNKLLMKDLKGGNK